MKPMTEESALDSDYSGIFLLLQTSRLLYSLTFLTNSNEQRERKKKKSKTGMQYFFSVIMVLF